MPRASSPRLAGEAFPLAKNLEHLPNAATQRKCANHYYEAPDTLKLTEVKAIDQISAAGVLGHW